MVPLYKDAEKKSYYKFLQPIEHVPEEEIKRVRAIQTDSSLAPQFSDRTIVQTPEYIPVPDGIYQMPDGTMFISCVTPAPNLTGEMIDWWMVWHMLDPLRYALWNPEDHYNTEISDEIRSRILDSSIPIRERLWGIDNTVTESWNGEKPVAGTLKFVEPQSVGFRNDLLGTDSCQSMLVANNTKQIGTINYPILMTETARKNVNGETEWVVAAWLGHGVKDGKDIQMKLPLFLRRKMAASLGTMFIIHSHKEVAHLNKVLPAIYAENKDNWLE